MSRETGLMRKNVNLGDVAAKLGVSRTTVSLVMNGHPRISKATARKVWKCVKEMGYQPNLLARSLATGRSNLIGLMVPDSSNPFFAEIFRGAEESARQKGWHLMLNNGSYNLELEEDRIRDLLSLRIGGLLACPGFVDDADSRKGVWDELQQQGLPVVLLNRQVSPQIFHQVTIDHADGIRQAIRYLHEQGHRRIGVIKPEPEILPVRQRMSEVKRQLASYKMNNDLIAGASVSLLGGYEAAKSIWEQSTSRPTAIFALTDTMALGAMRFLVDKGLRLPQDISVVGMDGTPYAQYGSVPLTSVEAPLFEMGKTLVDLLHKVIGEGTTSSLYSMVMPMTLIERASSGAASL